MRECLTAIIILFIIISSSCSSIHSLQPTGWSAFPSRPESDLSQKSSKNLTNELKVARLQYLEKKQFEFFKIMKIIDIKLEKLRCTADKNSAITLLTGGAGIASAVAATTLAVASPANTVWVAGLSAFGSGVMTFQMRAALEGYSRDAVARAYTETIAKIGETTAQIGADFDFLRKNIESTDDRFDKRAGELDEKIIKLYTASVLTPLIAGTDQDIEDLKRRNAEIQQQLKELKIQMDAITH